jgi:hypothetical protein
MGDVMKKREVEEAILQELDSTLAKAGFSLRKRYSSFVRRFPGGQHEIIVAVEDQRTFFRFSFGIRIRFDEVEKIFHIFSEWATDLQCRSCTAGGQLDYFMTITDHFVDTPALAGIWKSIQVNSTSQIADAFAIIGPVIKAKIIPFFDAHKDLVSVDQLLNPISQGAAIFDTAQVTRVPVHAMHALIVADLAGNKRFDGILRKWRKEMRGCNKMDAEKFDKLVDYLSHKREAEGAAPA